MHDIAAYTLNHLPFTASQSIAVIAYGATIFATWRYARTFFRPLIGSFLSEGQRTPGEMIRIIARYLGLEVAAVTTTGFIPHISNQILLEPVEETNAA